MWGTNTFKAKMRLDSYRFALVSETIFVLIKLDATFFVQLTNTALYETLTRVYMASRKHPGFRKNEPLVPSCEKYFAFRD